MNDDTRDPLRSLDRDVAPPAALEARVRRTLEGRGLLRPAMPTRRRLAAAAAALAVFAAGYMAGVGRPPTTPLTDAVPADGLGRYALFLYEDERFVPSRPEAELVAEYGAWGAGLAERGRLAVGEKLAAEAFLLEGRADPVVVAARDVAGDAGVVTGLFIILAASDAEALSIARTCPHLGYGGRIAVRPIEVTR